MLDEKKYLLCAIDYSDLPERERTLAVEKDRKQHREWIAQFCAKFPNAEKFRVTETMLDWSVRVRELDARHAGFYACFRCYSTKAPCYTSNLDSQTFCIEIEPVEEV